MFFHTPLNQPEAEIRLLYMDPNASSSNPSFTIKHVKLMECPIFRALSYTWGKSLADQHIYINGKPCKVYRNLFNFLQAALKDFAFFSETPIWVDQLCIDQTSIDERNHQVRLMSRIYGAAQTTLVWLGQGGLHGFDFIQDWYNHEYLASDTRENGRIGEYSVMNIGGQMYWSRAWIVQEIVLARDIILLRGNDKMAWKPFEAYVQSHAGDKVVKLILEIRQQFPSAQGATWLTISNFWTDMGELLRCKERLDKVFAVMNLVSPTQRFDVDYRHSPLRVALNVLQAAGLTVSLPTALEDSDAALRTNNWAETELVNNVCRELKIPWASATKLFYERHFSEPPRDAEKRQLLKLLSKHIISRVHPGFNNWDALPQGVLAISQSLLLIREREELATSVVPAVGSNMEPTNSGSSQGIQLVLPISSLQLLQIIDNCTTSPHQMVPLLATHFGCLERDLMVDA